MNRDLRALVLGGVTVALAWTVMRGIPGGLSFLARKEAELSQRADLVARGRARVSALEALGDSIHILGALSDQLPTVLLVGRDGETAAVDLMRRVRETVSARNATLTGFEQRTESASEPLVLVTLEAGLETDLRGLLDIVIALDGDPALAIEGLDIVATEPHADDTRAERLTVGLAVSGWYRPLDTVSETQAGAFLR